MISPEVLLTIVIVEVESDVFSLCQDPTSDSGRKTIFAILKKIYICYVNKLRMLNLKSDQAPESLFDYEDVRQPPPPLKKYIFSPIFGFEV